MISVVSFVFFARGKRQKIETARITQSTHVKCAFGITCQTRGCKVKLNWKILLLTCCCQDIGLFLSGNCAVNGILPEEAILLPPFMCV